MRLIIKKERYGLLNNISVVFVRNYDIPYTERSLCFGDEGTNRISYTEGY